MGQTQTFGTWIRMMLLFKENGELARGEQVLGPAVEQGRGGFGWVL